MAQASIIVPREALERLLGAIGYLDSKADSVHVTVRDNTLTMRTEQQGAVGGALTITGRMK